MAYQSLYRRYRPRRFSDVRGQEHVIRALRNAVREDRVGHAYMFSGPRGTGKTSTARILAKALNCENVVDGEPDGTCESCLSIDSGGSYDVQELDAASNNGVNDIRELISRVALGSPGRTKVYILDEVHMLSAAASAALLKTLEEPPDHVVFVLATTDPQKVLPTIRSRTQHYDFHLLSVEELSEHVAWVIHDAGLDLPDSVIDPVVRAGAGSARDTLSELDQVAAAGGVVDDGQPIDALLDAIAASEVGAALAALADAIGSGRDPRILGESVLARLRDIFLLRMGGGSTHLAPGDLERVQAWADQLGDRATTRALEAIGDALLEMRQAPDPRIPLEVALVKITRVGSDTSIDGLVARVAALEAALASGATAASGAATAPASGGSAAPAPSAPAPSAPGTASPPASRPRPADGARAQLAATRAASGRPAPPPRPDLPPTSRGAAAPAPSPKPTPAESAVTPEPESPAPAPAPSAPGTDAAAETDPQPGSTVVPEPTAPGAPAPSPAASSPATAAAPSDAAPGDAASDAPTTSSAAPEPAAAPASPPAHAGASITPEQITAVWNDDVLPSLGGLVKAMYAVGHFTTVDGETVTLALPNDVHRQKCEQRRTEVEAALSQGMGRPITLRLVTDEGAAHGNGDGAIRHDGGQPPEPPADDDSHLGGHDVHDLDDAPDARSGGLDALTEAFPGSEFVEDQ